jgi:hypothetical protein
MHQLLHVSVGRVHRQQLDQGDARGRDLLTLPKASPAWLSHNNTSQDRIYSHLLGVLRPIHCTVRVTNATGHINQFQERNTSLNLLTLHDQPTHQQCPMRRPFETTR